MKMNALGATELLRRLNKVGSAESSEELWLHMTALVAKCGVRFVAVVANEPSDLGWIPRVVFCAPLTEPALPLEINAVLQDPLFDRAMCEGDAIFLSDVTTLSGIFAQWLQQMAGDGAALIVPVGGEAGQSGFVAFAGMEQEFTSFVRSILVVSAHTSLLKLFDEFWRYESGLSGEVVDGLTTRERDCVRLLSEGKSNLEISLILGISARTVRFHIDNAKVKFGVESRVQLVIKAGQG